MSPSTNPIPVHVGSKPPTDWDVTERQQAEAGDQASAWLADQRRPEFASHDIDWAKHGLEPRWVGGDSVACAAAINPSQFSGHGATEFERFVLGAQKRQDKALVIHFIGSLEPPTRHNVFERNGASAPLIGFDCSVSGEQVGLESKLSLAPNLHGADKDLAKRIQGRSELLPAWALSVGGHTWSHPGGTTTHTQPTGNLQPLVVTDLDEPIAAVWISPDNSQRVYFLPAGTTPDTVLSWLAGQAFSEFAPSVLRSSRSPEPYRRALPTKAESEATEALRLFEQQTEQIRKAHVESVSVAHEAADSLRHDLLFGTGQALADAVAHLLRDAGIAVTDIDQMLGRTANADLLAELDGYRVIIEVKSAGGRPSEKLYDDLQSHLREWPTTTRSALDGGVLIINHQWKLEPEQRDLSPYNRPEFLSAQTSPVVSSTWLFDAWRTEDWARITSGIFGTVRPTPNTAQTPAGPDQPSKRRSLFKNR